jgi:lysozyme family protein
VPRPGIAPTALDGAAFAATFVDVDGGLGPRTVAAIRDFAPDWTVVFTPDV